MRSARALLSHFFLTTVLYFASIVAISAGEFMSSILIVDDDKNQVKAIQRILRSKGFETLAAYSGFEAGITLANSTTQ